MVEVEAHQSNGRIECITRTTRDGSFKLDCGPLERKMMKIVSKYNEICHVRIRHSPTKANEESRLEAIIEPRKMTHIKEYSSSGHNKRTRKEKTRFETKDQEKDKMKKGRFVHIGPR